MNTLEQWIFDRCNCNVRFIQGDIRGVALWFSGLGGGYNRNASDMELALAAENILVVTPFSGPWSWMNRLARQFTDELLDKIFEFYKLPDSLPVISCGGSMGGLAALLYCRYGKRRPAGCCALYPVCNMPYHFRERPDVSPSVCCAFYGYAEDFDEVLEEHSPLHQAAEMPRIPYLFIHGSEDVAVSKSHSDDMVKALRKLGHDVEYCEVPQMGHSCNVPLGIKQKAVDFVIGIVRKNA